GFAMDWSKLAKPFWPVGRIVSINRLNTKNRLDEGVRDDPIRRLVPRSVDEIHTFSQVKGIMLSDAEQLLCGCLHLLLKTEALKVFDGVCCRRTTHFVHVGSKPIQQGVLDRILVSRGEDHECHG